MVVCLAGRRGERKTRGCRWQKTDKAEVDVTGAKRHRQDRSTIAFCLKIDVDERRTRRKRKERRGGKEIRDIIKRRKRINARSATQPFRGGIRPLGC